MPRSQLLYPHIVMYGTATKTGHHLTYGLRVDSAIQK